MKKSLYLFSAALLVFVSCTSDYENSCIKKNDLNPVKNDTVSPPKTDSIPVVIVEPVLLKKLAHTFANGEVSTVEILYKDNKIVSDGDRNNFTYYTYTGNVITKIEKADLSGDIYSTKEYFYKNGQIDYIFISEFGNYYKMKYVYNSDGSVFYYKLNSDSSGNDGEDTGISGRYVFSKGNLIQNQYYTGSTEVITTYEYDSKNNPRLNTLGIDLLVDYEVYGVNNPIKKTVKATNGNNVMIQTITYSYEYDANGYPVKRTETSQIGDVITTETSTYSY